MRSSRIMLPTLVGSRHGSVISSTSSTDSGLTEPRDPSVGHPFHISPTKREVCLDPAFQRRFIGPGAHRNDRHR